MLDLDSEYTNFGGVDRSHIPILKVPEIPKTDRRDLNLKLDAAGGDIADTALVDSTHPADAHFYFALLNTHLFPGKNVIVIYDFGIFEPSLIEQILPFHAFFQTRPLHVEYVLGSHISHSVYEFDFVPALLLAPHLQFNKQSLLLIKLLFLLLFYHCTLGRRRLLFNNCGH